MTARTTYLVPLAAAMLSAGCATLPPDRGVGEAATLVAARSDAALAEGVRAPDEAATRARVDALLAEPLGVDAAMRLAIANHPRSRQAWARLGMAQADAWDAARLPNPTFGFADLHPEGGGTPQITRSVGLDVAALLSLAPRRRLAAGERERAQLEAASEWLAVATDSESAWYGYVGACQSAQLRAKVAVAAELSAAFAQRMRDAGNLDALGLALEQASATHARLESARADSRRLQARATLAAALGIPVTGDWTVDDRLPAPPAGEPAYGAWVETATSQRLDLAALRQELATLEDAAGVAHRWRWLGAFELGYERENDSDGARLRGPTVSVEVPLFDQGQGTVLRADARVEEARARLDAAELQARNDVALGLDRMATTRAIAERYRTALLPQREAVVARTAEHVNFMFKGQFELIAARRDQYDAYEEYLESVRDYWTARAELRRAAGGRLPDDDDPRAPTLDVDGMVDPPDEAPPAQHHHESGDAP